MPTRSRIVLFASTALIAAVMLLFARSWANDELTRAWRSLGAIPKLGIIFLLLGALPLLRGVAVLARRRSSSANKRKALALPNLGLLLLSLAAGVGLLQFAWYGLLDGVDCAGSACIRAFIELRSGVLLFLSLSAIPLAGLAIWHEVARDEQGAA